MKTAIPIIRDDFDSKYYLYLFIIWPFLAFLLALGNYSQKGARRVVYFFLIYYGLTFVNSSEGVDAYNYILTFQQNARLPFSAFFDVVGGLYSGTSIDLVEPLISFFVSRFTTFHGAYFAVWAAIFGFFYLKSVNLIYDRYQLNPGWNTMIPMAFFALILPISSINGVRMWTAAWIFFYGAYHVILYRDKRYLVLAMAASLVHWSFFSANAILLIYAFVGNRNYIYLPLALISFVASDIFFGFFGTLASWLGGSIQGRFEGYASVGNMMVEQISRENASWFILLGNDLIFYYLLFVILIIQINTWYLEKDGKMKNLYSFLLIFLAFVNFGKPIPTFGLRFQIVFMIFATLYLFLYYARIKTERIQVLVLLGLLPMMLKLALTFRLASHSISLYLFTPGLGFPLLAPAKSLYDILFS
jgi:hypothetical protein